MLSQGEVIQYNREVDLSRVRQHINLQLDLSGGIASSLLSMYTVPASENPRNKYSSRIYYEVEDNNSKSVADITAGPTAG